MWAKFPAALKSRPALLVLWAALAITAPALPGWLAIGSACALFAAMILVSPGQCAIAPAPHSTEPCAGEPPADRGSGLR